MIQLTPPVVENLVRNLPAELKVARQFLPWSATPDGKKVPLAPDGTYGNAGDPKYWRLFEEVVELVEKRKAFGLGMVIVPGGLGAELPEYNLMTGLVAIDADAKRCAHASPFKIPESISQPVRMLQTYTEVSTSTMGLRALAFGTISTTKQHITKTFADGTEFSLYRGGWVTLSGAHVGDSPATVEHCQDGLDRIVAELRPEPADSIDLNAAGMRAGALPSGETYVLDWSRTAGDERVRKFLSGLNRSAVQSAAILATWDLERGWNHGGTPDASMYTKRIVEEALWLKPYMGWSLQDVVDLVVTFCRRKNLDWSAGRARKQISDGQMYIATHRGGRVAADNNPPPPLTGNDDKIIPAENPGPKQALIGHEINLIQTPIVVILPDTLVPKSKGITPLKVSGHFNHRSGARDAVLHALGEHRGWVKAKTIASETGRSTEAARKQLERLRAAGLVQRDGNGRYRRHRERQARKLKACASKPFPKQRHNSGERKTLSLGELKRRGWPLALIEELLPAEGSDFRKGDVTLWDGRIVKTRFYWISRIRALEAQATFEEQRTKAIRLPSGVGPKAGPELRRPRSEAPVTNPNANEERDD